MLSGSSPYCMANKSGGGGTKKIKQHKSSKQTYQLPNPTIIKPPIAKSQDLATISARI